MTGSTSTSGQGQVGFVITSLAVIYAAALLPIAYFAPLYSEESGSSRGDTVRTTNTLVGVNGTWVLLLVSVPLLLTVAGWVGLHARSSRGSSLGGIIAWSAAGFLSAFALIGLASIGLLLMPAALLLVLGAALTPTGSSATSTA